MSVSKKTVEHVSLLSRLDLRAGGEGAEAEKKLERFARQMDEIVGYMDILNRADTAGVEPMYSPLSLSAPPRADEPASDYTREEVLSNAPEAENGFFVVPRVI